MCVKLTGDFIMNSLSALSNQSSINFQAKIPNEALKLKCDYVGQIVKNSPEELTKKISTLKKKETYLAKILENNPNNIDTRLMLSEIRTDISTLKAQLAHLLF